MLLLLFLFYPFLEIVAYYFVIQKFGFWDAFSWIFVSGFFGFVVMLVYGKKTFSVAQKAMSQGQMMNSQLVHKLCFVFGGFLIFLPGIVSDLTGVFLLLPGTRHLFILTFKQMILKKAYVVVNNRVFGQPSGPNRSSESVRTQAYEREAEVIDITALSSRRKTMIDSDGD